MAATNKKAMSIGIFLALSFLGVLLLIFSPVFGEGKNGLQFSDELFNKLSKGSSYFIPKVAKSSQKLAGRDFSLTVRMEKPEQAQKAVQVLTAAGVQAKEAAAEVKVSGDLGRLLSMVLQDSDAMYRNDGKTVAGRYGFDEREVMATWWTLLKQFDKELKKGGKIEEAKVVNDVMKKAVEAAYNFYGIEAQKVTDKAGLMAGLLLFYVAYTMWWGFAIFYLFEGFGLTMKKAKVKKEV